MRQFKNLLLSLFLLTAAFRAEAVNWTDIYWNPTQGGQGYNVVQTDDFIFVTFFIYGPDGKPTWYIAALTWNGTDAYTGPLSLTTGTYWALAWVPANFTEVEVGTASFKPVTGSNYRATLTFTVNGVGTVVKQIERQNLTPVALGGNFVGADVRKYTGCATTPNETFYDFFSLQVSHFVNGNVTLLFDYGNNFTCTFTGVLEQHGQLYRIVNATYVCSDGLSTTAAFPLLRATYTGIEGTLTSSTVGDGCTETTTFSGTLQ